MHEGNTEEENSGYVVFEEYVQDQLGNRVVVRGEGVKIRPLAPPLFLYQASEQILKDDVNGFSSTSDIGFMIPCLWSTPVLEFLNNQWGLGTE